MFCLGRLWHHSRPFFIIIPFWGISTAAAENIFCRLHCVNPFFLCKFAKCADVWFLMYICTKKTRKHNKIKVLPNQD